MKNLNFLVENKRKLIVTSVWIISIIIAFQIGIGCEQMKSAFEPVTETEPIMIKGKTKVYIKKHSWGLLGNHSVVYLTNNQSQTMNNENKDQILSTSGPIFFKLTNDTLKIYCRTIPDMNPNCKFDVPVQYIKLENPDFMNLYDQMTYQLKCSEWM